MVVGCGAGPRERVCARDHSHSAFWVGEGRDDRFRYVMRTAVDFHLL